MCSRQITDVQLVVISLHTKCFYTLMRAETVCSTFKHPNLAPAPYNKDAIK